MMVVGTDARQFGGWLGVGLGREGNSLSLSIEVQVSHLVSVVLSVVQLPPFTAPLLFLLLNMCACLLWAALNF